MYSDGCQKIKNAVNDVYPLSKHHLCVWHVKQNVKRHFKVALRDSWETFSEMFDRILKCSDSHSRATFNHEWGQLRALVSDRVSENLLDYLGGPDSEETAKFNLYAYREAWAYRYTHADFAYGTNTTGRAESMFNLIKDRVKPGSSLLDMYNSLNDFARELERSAAAEAQLLDEKLKKSFPHPLIQNMLDSGVLHFIFMCVR